MIQRVGDPIVWSFFTGVMGLDLGFERMGLHPSLAVDVDPVVCQTIRANRPDLRVLENDVAELSGHELRTLTGVSEVDLMIGGPPCQSFCPGGKRSALSDARGNAIFEYLRLIDEIRPRRFLLENVANLVTAAVRHRPIAERPGKSWNLASYGRDGRPYPQVADGATPLAPDEQSGSAIRLLLETAVAELGYNVAFGVLDAARFGAPQRRHRFVMLADRDSPPPPLPDPTHGAGLEPELTVGDAIADLQDDPGPGSQYTPAVRSVFDLVPPGGNWRDLPADVALTALGERSYRAGGGKTGFFRRLSWENPAPTVTGRANRKGSALCHPQESRPLSVRECARLQCLPEDWRVCGSMNKQYLQVGNAVPVELGAAIARSMLAPGVRAPDNDTMLEQATQTLRAAARNKRSALVCA